MLFFKTKRPNFIRSSGKEFGFRLSILISHLSTELCRRQLNSHPSVGLCKFGEKLTLPVCLAVTRRIRCLRSSNKKSKEEDDDNDDDDDDDEEDHLFRKIKNIPSH